MTHLLLIRHALNDWVKDRLAGWTPGVHLNEEGRQQCERLSRLLAAWPLGAVYASPLERAVETAEFVARPHNLPVRICEGVGEARYGEWTGGELKELAKTETWTGVQVYPSGTRFPGGESMQEVQTRAVAAVDAIVAAHPKQMVAVVSHADVIKAMVAHYLGMHLDLFQRIVVDTASVTHIVFTRFAPRLLRLNYTCELAVPKLEEEAKEDQQDDRTTTKQEGS